MAIEIAVALVLGFLAWRFIPAAARRLYDGHRERRLAQTQRRVIEDKRSFARELMLDAELRDELRELLRDSDKSD